MSLRREWLRNNKKMIGNEVIYTKSTHFIMPMIGYIADNFNSYNGEYNYLINCHLDLINNKIIVIIDNTDDYNILKLLQYNKSNIHYEGFKSDDDENEIVLTYKIPEEHKEDFDIFLTSKYSKMSEQYKRKLVGLYGRVTNTEDYKPTKFDILYPTTFKRQQWADRLGVDISIIDEVSPELNMDYEQYKTIEELLPTINKQVNETGQ
jgi:hypothetical protein